MTAAAVHTAGLTVAQVAAAIDAPMPAGVDGDAALGPVSIDARSVASGGVFVALQGTNSHGASFAGQARAAGAVAMVVGSDAPAELVTAARSEVELVLVSPLDAVTALGRIARAWRRSCGFTVVGITGSAGKTSTKDILGGLLSSVRRTVWSHANHNNEIGVPLTLLAADAQDEVVICEMGMRGLGQIDYLCEVAEPDVGLVTNAGTAHLELLGSREAIVQAKAELLAGVASGGVAIAPADQPELWRHAGKVGDRTELRFGDADDATADARVLSVERTHLGLRGRLAWRSEAELDFELPVHGVHQARNLAAAACAYVAVTGGIDGLREAVAHVRLTAGRGDRHVLGSGALLIDDAYNANPESMRAALVELAAAPARRRLAVLGAMAELGAESPSLHAQLGSDAASLVELDELVVVTAQPEAVDLADAWEQATGRIARRSSTVDDALEDVRGLLVEGDVLLVKGSNGVGLGSVVAALRDLEDGDDA